MEVITIDVAPFLQVIDEAFKFAYFTVVGLGFVAAMYAMGSILLTLWRGSDVDD